MTYTAPLAARAPLAIPPGSVAMRAGITALTIVLLAACSAPEDPTKVLADYNARIARALDAGLPPITATRVPTWPTGDDIRQPATDLRVGVFGGPDFGRCSLLREISARDGDSGLMQAPAQRLLYEMRLLRGLNQCRSLTAADLTDSDPARRSFATSVDHVFEVKRRDLPVIYWNATFGAAELRQFFSVGATPLRMREVSATNEAASALSWLATLGRLTPDDPLPAAEAIAQQYMSLVGSKHGGRTWLTIDLARRELDRSSALLEQAAATHRLCPNGAPAASAAQLHQVFAEIYVKRLDPWLATAGHEAWVLTDALEHLWQAQRVPPPPTMERYRTKVWAKVPGSLVQDYDVAVRRHVLAWKAALGPCGYPSSGS